MTQNAYLLFHLNLAFSSIERETFEEVIRKCYDPLLDLIEEERVPVGIELTGWTLQQIQLIRPDWILKFKYLLQENMCELIGSGYSQVIGPLVPYEVNDWNQKLGIDSYRKILGCRPSIALVNEMAYASDLISIYKQHGYHSIAMDEQNLNLACGFANQPDNCVRMIRDQDGIVMPLLATDTILFQKLQHFVHGDISIAEYLEYVRNHRMQSNNFLCVYCNDAEVFDFRPGRFATERKTHPDGEWNRLRLLLNSLRDEFDINFMLPSEIIKSQKYSEDKFFVSNAAYPIPVKKQRKYNIARWGLTGRNDVKLNTFCQRIYAKFMEQNVVNPDDWKILCELWSSDYRTHITKKKWVQLLKKLKLIYNKYNIHKSTKYNVKSRNVHDITDVSEYKGNGFNIIRRNDGNIIRIKNRFIDVTLNLRRGLTIEELMFSKHNFENCLGKIQHGHFNNIELGADFYSGGVIIESISSRQRLTDLEAVTPEIFFDEENDLHLKANIHSPNGTITKEIRISSAVDKITIRYEFQDFSYIGFARVGILTFKDQFAKASQILCKNGGSKLQAYEIKGEFDHTRAVSSFVSCTTGFGCTSGEFLLFSNDKSLRFKWNEERAKVLLLMSRFEEGNKELLRTMFSIKELDDTSKTPTKLLPFEFSIESGNR